MCRWPSDIRHRSNCLVRRGGPGRALETRRVAHDDHGVRFTAAHKVARHGLLRRVRLQRVGARKGDEHLFSVSVSRFLLDRTYLVGKQSVNNLVLVLPYRPSEPCKCCSRAVQVSLTSRASVSREPYKCLSRAVQASYIGLSGEEVSTTFRCPFSGTGEPVSCFLFLQM